MAVFGGLFYSRKPLLKCTTDQRQIPDFLKYIRLKYLIWFIIHKHFTMNIRKKKLVLYKKKIIIPWYDRQYIQYIIVNNAFLYSLIHLNIYSH